MKLFKITESNKFYNLGERIETALRYIENINLSNLENGKYVIDGDDIFAVVQDYQTKAQSEAKWEVHKKYIDIQIVIKGREQMGWGLVENFSPITEYDKEKDILFLEGEGTFSELKEDYLAIISPEYAHMPSISVGEKPEYVKKVVVKVKA